MARKISVAAIQTAYGEDMAANIAKTADFIRQAADQGAQVILPSELFQGHYFCVAQEEKWFATAFPWREHPCVTALAPLAGELGVVQQGGRYVLVRRDIAEQVRAIDARQLALLVDPAAAGVGDDGVPDDLMW